MPQNLENMVSASLQALPDKLRQAIASIPFNTILYDIGRAHGLSIETVGQLAEAAAAFVSGETDASGLLQTLLPLVSNNQEKNKALARALNERVFKPIRDALKLATTSPTPIAEKPYAPPAAAARPWKETPKQSPIIRPPGIAPQEKPVEPPKKLEQATSVQKPVVQETKPLAPAQTAPPLRQTAPYVITRKELEKEVTSFKKPEEATKPAPPVLQTPLPQLQAVKPSPYVITKEDLLKNKLPPAPPPPVKKETQPQPQAMASALPAAAPKPEKPPQEYEKVRSQVLQEFASFEKQTEDKSRAPASAQVQPLPPAPAPAGPLAPKPMPLPSPQTPPPPPREKHTADPYRESVE